MKRDIYKKTQMLRTLLVVSSLLFATLVSAQQSLAEVSLEYQKEGNRYLHNGKPLDGCYKVSYFTDNFVARYYIANFKDGVQGDTIRHYDTKSDALLNEDIRLNNRETLHRKLFFDGSLFEQYRTTSKGREGIYEEWYKNGNLRRRCEYVDGMLNGNSSYWEDDGRLIEVLRYKDNLQDGWSTSWIYEETMTNVRAIEMVCSLYKEGGSPVVEECYAVDVEPRSLVKRTVFDQSGEIYSALKDGCDSTCVDSLEDVIEVRDYKQGKLLSVERFTYDWTPHGVFETYYDFDGGGIASRKRYEWGKVVAEVYYDSEPQTDMEQTSLTPAMCADLKRQSRNSKYFGEGDDRRSLIIRNRFGDEILNVSDDEGRRYEYYGYDPKQMLHLAFSSKGDFYNVCYYVVHDDGVSLSLPVDQVAVNGDVGTIVTAKRLFDGEDELVFYRCFSEGDGVYFTPVFEYTAPHPLQFIHMYWVGDYALVLEYKDGGVRLDFAPGLFEPIDEFE